MTQIDVMEKTLQAQRPQLNFLTAVTLVSVRRLVSWDTLQTRRTVASKRRKNPVNIVHFVGEQCSLFYTFTFAIIKVIGETPKVRSDKGKPREDSENHRYHI